MGIENDTPGWSLTRRVLFRFAFAYLTLFCVFGGNSPLTLLWDPLVLWVGRWLFGVTITVRPEGSGDTTWNYVQLFCFLAVAVLGAAAWSVLDRKRTGYERLADWLRAIVRYSLAMTMMFYGVAKLVQFPSPPVDWLAQPLGEGSPMRLLWAFMGASKTYCLFTGAVEVAGGLLLVNRRTALLGALVSAGAMANVVLLNFCYDVPVKILSSHLLGMALFLIAPDLPRLAALFVLNRRVERAPDRPLFERAWLRRTGLALRALYVLFCLAWPLLLCVLVSYMVAQQAPRAPVAGAWEVEEFTVDGQVRPPLLTDAERWRRVYVTQPGAVGIQGMDGAPRYYKLAVDEGARTLTLTKPAEPEARCALHYEESEPGRLTLAGAFEGHEVRARLRPVSRSDYLLVNRGFHWVNETPFNR